MNYRVEYTTDNPAYEPHPIFNLTVVAFVVVITLMGVM